MEVIPFLVLAVGVDNMFVLAHAMGKQVGAGRGGRKGGVVCPSPTEYVPINKESEGKVGSEGACVRVFQGAEVILMVCF